MILCKPRGRVQTVPDDVLSHGTGDRLGVGLKDLVVGLGEPDCYGQCGEVRRVFQYFVEDVDRKLRV